MGCYLSIDGGGTKTAFLLCDEKGKPLYTTWLGASNYMVDGMEHTFFILTKGLEEVLSATGRSPKEISFCFAALAGYGDIPEETGKLDEEVQKIMGVIPARCANDTENAIAGSLAGKSGIHVIAGTGSIGIGIDDAGKHIKAGGWHHLFGGDEGSAYWISCRLIQHFTKQADGREEKTALYEALKEGLDLKSDEDILDLVIHQWNGKREKIASLASYATELAEQKDPAALQIVDQAAEELAMIVKAVRKKGTFSSPVPVSYSGGVFNSGEIILGPLRKRLGEEYVIHEPVLKPLQGGILLAMKEDGRTVEPSIIRNLSGE